jgi:type VII secretion-associated protein (TIGR03931 family)
VTEIVVEVGPATVRGPNPVAAEWVAAGIEAIDDELSLVDDRPVGTAEVWQKVMRDVTGGRADAVVVVCPTWWPSSWVQRVRDATGTVSNDAVALRRAEVLKDSRSALVEIAPEFVALSLPGGRADLIARGDTDALVAKIPVSMAVVVDADDSVEGAALLGSAIADRLRDRGFAVAVADPDWVRRSVEAVPSQEEAEEFEARPSSNRGGRKTAVLVGAVLSAAALCGGWVARHDGRPPPADVPMTLLVEGRVGVMVPARWMVQRVTSGPGSVRVQVVSPDDVNVAVHVAQSSLALRQSREQVAASLRAALSQEPDGVFVDFNPSDHRADKQVMTYHEIRADRHVAWFVLIDESLRIAIGCQSAPGREETVRETCDRAIRSAHAVF